MGKTEKMLSNTLKRELPLHIMLIPAIVFVVIFSYVPMIGGVIAFEKFNPALGMFKSPWVGMENFKRLIDMPEVSRALMNTLIIAGMKIVAGQITPIIIALLLNEITKNWYKRTVQTIIYLPHFLSWVILGGLVLDVFSLTGGLNKVIGLLGIEPIFFLGDNRYFRYILVLTDVWKNFGFSTIVYMAAIAGINPTLYEACVMDGGNRWRQTCHITLPGIVPIIVLTATLSMRGVLDGGFDQIFTLYNPAVYQSADIIDTIVYRIGIMQSQYSLASAIGLFKSLVSTFMIGVSYYIAYKITNYRIF